MTGPIVGAFAAAVLAGVMVIGALPVWAASPSTVRTSANAGTGAAETSAMTPDGNREVMVGRGTGNAGVWLVDRTNGDAAYHITTGMDFNPAISADGNWVAYVRYGSARNVYLVNVSDLNAVGQPELVSRADGATGPVGNGASDYPSVSGDGRYVAFQSTATNLDVDTSVPSSGGPNKVYVRDRTALTTEMVSVDNSGAAQPGNGVKPSISQDGQYVAFASEADLSGPVSGAAEETTATFQQVWVRDQNAGTTTVVSVDSSGVLGNAGSALVYGPSINADGKTVAFESDSTNLVPADTNGRTDSFAHDMTSGATTRVSERTPFDQFGAFHGVSPSRLLDTRTSGVPIGPGQTIELQVADVAGVPADAAAVALNVTVTAPTGPGFFTVFPTGDARPTASNLNFVTGETRANAVTVKVGTDGKISIYNHFTSTAHAVVDLNGWYDDASVSAGGGFVSTQPARLLDTRDTGTPVGPGQTIDLQVAGVAGVPSSATAVALNVTATAPTGAGFLTVFPAGDPQPTASNLNFAPGETNPNTVIVKLGVDGKISIYNHFTSTTHVVVDLNGWFDSTLPGGGFTGITPARLLDTRTSGVPIGPGQTLDFQVAGAGGVPAYGVTAVALNVTVTEPTGPGFFTVFPTGVARPLASNLNFVPTQTAPNEVLVQVGANGKVSIYNHFTSTAHAVVDVVGWYSGTQVSEGGSGPAVSADGQHVAFESLSSTLTQGDVNGVSDAFVRDLGSSLTERVSVVDETNPGTEATGTRIDGNTGEVVAQKNGADVTISDDGTLVGFTSNGDLANDRPAGEEPGTISTESAIFTRTRS